MYSLITKTLYTPYHACRRYHEMEFSGLHEDEQVMR